MQREVTFWLISAAILMNILVLDGCALRGSDVTETGRPKPARDTSKNGWWYARFHMDWPENTEPNRYLDVILAHEIVSPLLNQYRENIQLWRVHRRFARDKAGHQFSFIFYAAPPTAREIFLSIQADPFFKRLKQVGIIVGTAFDDPAMLVRRNIEDTSDPSWSIQIQKSWPHFIMGVSQTWLNLIAKIVEKYSNENKPASLEEVQAFYQQVDETITAAWQEEGQHVYLHHLNAIFGYQPVIVYEKRLMTF
ncbi:MAG: hypothetical protein PVI06_14975 [Desulfobacterales bacterium]|jgi:hypothetical protein